MSEALSKPDLPKRFYKDVAVSRRDDGAFAVLLDGRPIRTPAKRLLAVPSQRVGEVLAGEWQAQAERIDPATMPMTRLVNTVLDGIADDPAPVRDDLARYIESDLLFYRAGAPNRLVMRQTQGWDPVVAWAESVVGGRFVLGEGVMFVSQPPETLRLFRARLARFEDPFAVAALHQMTTLTGSALLALAVAEGRLAPQEAWSLAHIDEDWNIELWGHDEEAAGRRKSRFTDMRTAAALLGRG